VIPVRNDAARLRRCLETIAAIDYPGHLLEIVVADNGSADDSRAVAEQAGARVVTLPGIRVSELRNRAGAIARGDVIVFIDADHEIEPHWMRSALEVLQLAGVAVAGAICIAPSDGTWVQRTYDALRDHTPGRAEVEWIGSGTMAIWRDVFEKIGGFDTSLETCEDVDLCRRVRAAGQRVMSDAALATLHWGDPATLRAVFAGELWRGRDNLRASLRGPLSWRSLPSIAIPLIDLCCVVIATGAVAGLFTPRLLLAAAAAVVFVSLAALRPARMVWRGGGTDFATIARALVISCAHDLARALAIVIRMPHRRAAIVPPPTAVRT
jgi:hypothetical protein